MADNASIQFQDLRTSEQAVHVPSHQTGVARPRTGSMKVAPLSSKNASSSGRRTSWEVSHSPDGDNPLDTPLPYDAYTGGKSYRDFPT